jgi:6-phosphogluconolactonase
MRYIFRNPQDAAMFLAETWFDKAGRKIREKGRFAVALSGGKTPVILYEALARERTDPAWKNTHIFLADERYVPRDHPDSNGRLVRESLINRLQVKIGSLHGVETERAGPEEAAQKYQDDLYAFFGSRGSMPVFDLVLLGIGKDGHTASLFSGSPALDETARLAVPVQGNNIPHVRITLTLPVLNSAEEVIFFVTGKEKAAMLGNILNQGFEVPAARVCPGHGLLEYVLDEEAAAELVRR